MGLYTRKFLNKNENMINIELDAEFKYITEM